MSGNMPAGKRNTNLNEFQRSESGSSDEDAARAANVGIGNLNDE